MYRFLIILFASILFSGFTVSKKVKLPLALHTDSSKVSVRHYNGQTFKDYLNRPEFQYKETVPTTNWWDRFWEWFWSLFQVQGLKASSIFLVILKYLLIGLGLAAIVLVIFKLMGVDIAGIFKKKSASTSIEYHETLENIHEIDFDKELENAIAQHNFRLAVRLLYLKCLKELNDAQLIKWEINKTNSEYVREMIGTNQGDSFNKLTRQFEYVWYGEFLINADLFHTINISFQDFKQQVK
jgi:hypothetical protein